MVIPVSTTSQNNCSYTIVSRGSQPSTAVYSSFYFPINNNANNTFVPTKEGDQFKVAFFFPDFRTRMKLSLACAGIRTHWILPLTKRMHALLTSPINIILIILPFYCRVFILFQTASSEKPSSHVVHYSCAIRDLTILKSLHIFVCRQRQVNVELT